MSDNRWLGFAIFAVAIGFFSTLPKLQFLIVGGGAVVAEGPRTAELVTVAKEEDQQKFRRWFITQGPDAINRAVMALDGTNDPHGKIRDRSLQTISSLSAEGLDAEVVKTWATTLKSLASALYHDGPERSDYVARSYLMEGRTAEATIEYRRFPTSAAAQVFFETHGEKQRLPAGN